MRVIAGEACEGMVMGGDIKYQGWVAVLRAEEEKMREMKG